MKYRVTSACVKVTGPPARICSLNKGTTEPLEPNTLPKRTMQKHVLLLAAKACNTISANRLVAPITLVGLTALSVLIKTKLAVPYFCAARAKLRVPSTLFCSPSAGLCSTKGTCL